MLSMTVLCFASPNRFVWEEELYTELMLYILFGVIDRPLAVSFVRLRTAPLFFCAPYRVRAHAQVPAVLLAVAAHAHGASLSLSLQASGGRTAGQEPAAQHGEERGPVEVSALNAPGRLPASGDGRPLR